MTSVLNNIRILDFSWVLAGPYATRLLADFGAEVIKVQPLFSYEKDTRFDLGYYNFWNRNKLGVTLNLSNPEGVDIAKRLVGICDAVVESFTPRVMDNWRMDYDRLKEIKPDIIMLSMSAMGHTGPWRDYAGFGPTVQAFSGITFHTSYPGRPPAGLGFSYADHVAGLYASLSLLAALEHRQKTGEGQYIDLSQLETLASLLGDEIIRQQHEGESGSLSEAPHNVYRCKGDDRWCAISVTTEVEWLALKKVMGNPQWAGDKKYASAKLRLQHREELDELIESWTLKHAPEQVMEILQGEGVAAGIVQDAGDLARNHQLKARSFFMENSVAGPDGIISDASPIKMDLTPAGYRKPAPWPGEDNDYVYGELLGLSADEISALKQGGII
jgi:crotonobetainyl-CoA:carnitine CoA-transferase CaiB-like acyl-CoA transferase